MNQILIDIDTEFGFHPPKVVIRENGKTLIDMPADEFVGWIKTHLGFGKAAAAFAERVAGGVGPCRPKSEENNEGDRPCEDGLRSDSLPETGC